MKKYESPSMEVIEIKVSDVISTSGAPGFDFPHGAFGNGNAC